MGTKVVLFYLLVSVQGMLACYVGNLWLKAWPNDTFPILYTVDWVWLLLVGIVAVRFWRLDDSTVSQPTGAELHRKGMPEGAKVVLLSFPLALGLVSTVDREWQWLLSSLLIAPVIEEVLFRAYLLKRMLQIHGPNLAIILNSLLFLAAHVNLIEPMAWRAYFTVLGGGLVFGIVFSRYGLVPAILVHAGGNLGYHLTN